MSTAGILLPPSVRPPPRPPPRPHRGCPAGGRGPRTWSSKSTTPKLDKPDLVYGNFSRHEIDPQDHACLPRLVCALVVGACGDTADSPSGDGSGRRQALARRLLDAARRPTRSSSRPSRRPPAGKGVTFNQSYGASGDQARAVDRRPARRRRRALARARRRRSSSTTASSPPDWNADAYEGHRHGLGRRRSPSARATRRTSRRWDDLIKPGVEVITPNPFTSGGARWNVMAAYGAQIEQGKTDAQAIDYLEQLFKNVVVQDKCAREALQTFTAGKGDVLLAYENEAITAQQKGEDLDYVIPDQTILIENPIAVTTDSEDARRRKAFVDFAALRAGAEDLRRQGLPPGRSTRSSTSRSIPTPPSLFTSRSSAAGTRSMTKFFDPDRTRSCKDRGGPRCLHGLTSRSVAAARRCRAGARGRRPRRRRRRRARDRLPEPDRPDPARRRRRRVARRRRRRRSGTRSPSPQAVAALKLTLIVLAGRRRDQRRHRHADRLGARARRVPRQALRQRAHRPAVRAADDRRRPRRCSRSTGRRARLGIDVAFTRGGRRARAAVRDAAVRRALGAARAASSSTARWRRRRRRSARGR